MIPSFRPEPNVAKGVIVMFNLSLMNFLTSDTSKLRIVQSRMAGQSRRFR